MSAGNGRRKNNFSLLGMGASAIAVVAFLLLSGCPTDYRDWVPPPPPEGGLGALPATPIITDNQQGFAFREGVDMTDQSEIARIMTAENYEDYTVPVISLTWTGGNTDYFNIYWSLTPRWPGLDLEPPQITGVRDTVYFIREGLLPQTQYFVWVEAVNANGTSLSAPFDRSTMKAFPHHSDGGIERGDYARGIQIEPAGGQLTIWWDLAHRIGWHEIYFIRTQDIDPDWETFPFIEESWGEGDFGGPLVPYQTITSSRFPQWFVDNLIPWDDVNGERGTPGVPIRHFRNHVTITGLQNGVEYEVWIRVPNVQGERGFSRIRGTPGGVVLPAPRSIMVTAPQGTTRNLEVSWNPVAGAQAYRIYYSAFNEEPGPRSPFQRIATQNNNTGRQGGMVLGLLPGTQYFIWVTAEQGGARGAFSDVLTGTTGLPTTGQMRPRLDVNGHRITTLLYVEVNDNNILNAGDYILEDGTFLWDYVVIFAANLRQRDCSPEAHIHGCDRSGIHVHFNENVRHIMTNYSTFIRPLQEKGIRVKLGLLGDWDGVGFGSLSAEEIEILARDIAEIMERYDLDGVDFDDEWANDMRFGGFGSVAEWQNAEGGQVSATAVYPQHAFGWPFGVTVFRDPTLGIHSGNVRSGAGANPGASLLNEMWWQGGRNLYMMLRATRDAFNALEPRLPVRPQDIAYQEGVRRLTISLYEFNKARWITPASADRDGVIGNEGPTLTNHIWDADSESWWWEGGNVGGVNIRATPESLAEIIDFAMQPWYNQWHWDSPNRLPRTIFSPLAIDISGHAYAGQDNSPNPTFPGREGPGRPLSIQTVANRFRAVSDAAAGLSPGESPYVGQYIPNAPIGGDPYGMMFFFNLRPASCFLARFRRAQLSGQWKSICRT